MRSWLPFIVTIVLVIVGGGTLAYVMLDSPAQTAAAGGDDHADAACEATYAGVRRIGSPQAAMNMTAEDRAAFVENITEESNETDHDEIRQAGEKIHAATIQLDGSGIFGLARFTMALTDMALLCDRAGWSPARAGL
jgi:hypothetical protein